MRSPSTRRQFLKQGSVAAAAASVPFVFSGVARSADQQAQAAARKSPNERFTIGCIGTGSRWGAVGPSAMGFGDIVAVCDVDRQHAEQAQKLVASRQNAKAGTKEIAVHEDYRKVLDDPSIDVVTIVTPDHWHSKIVIEALQAGKDVYCEKPLTLTIEEGDQIIRVLNETKRVVQVGTQQRSEMGGRFLTAVALIREGRLGDIKSVQCAIGGSPTSGPIAAVEPPPHLNWDMWLGQAPKVDYRWEKRGNSAVTRCHYEFRWWYEYSGGKMTDWGAHHVDIAQWAIDQSSEGQGPTRIEPISAVHPVKFDEYGNPTDETQYNAATRFQVKAAFPGGIEMIIRDDTENGILFEGTEGRIFVSRGSLKGKPVEDLASNPLPEDAIRKIYKGKEPQSHMGNFFECVRNRSEPISDVWSHVTALNTCHLANIAIRLNRTLEWDAKARRITNDERGLAMQAREQRKGYEIKL